MALLENSFFSKKRTTYTEDFSVTHLQPLAFSGSLAEMAVSPVVRNRCSATVNEDVEQPVPTNRTRPIRAGKYPRFFISFPLFLFHRYWFAGYLEQ